jgi:hypothetical protein
MNNNYYYAYLEGCRAFNKLNDLPERGWELHHILPQCLFYGHGPTLWLTKEQHSVASALQTFAFGVNCVCPWHVKLMPSRLWEAVRDYFVKDKQLIGKETFKKKVGCHAPGMASRGSQKAKEKEVGALFASSIQLSEWGRIGGSKGGSSGLNANPDHIRERSGKGGRKVAAILYMDPNHPELGAQNAGNLVRMQRKRNLPSGPENRVKVTK